MKAAIPRNLLKLILVSGPLLSFNCFPQVAGENPNIAIQREKAKQAQAKMQEAKSQATVEGCLRGSDGHYTLTDKSGRTYQLQGDTSKFSARVGHDVQITTTAHNAPATDSATKSTGTQQPTLAVKEVKDISASCPAITQK